jgi:hypothetical protein
VASLGVCLLVACEKAESAGSSSPGSAGDRHSSAQASAASSPEALRDGDIIFQESQSPQSAMVAALTKSQWTHMGIIFMDPSGPVVLEAVAPVKYTDLAGWIARGRGHHYVIKRLRDSAKVGPDTVRAMRAIATGWLGRPYDTLFRWDDKSFYCSELVYKLYERGAHTTVGRIQRADEMNLAEIRVQKALTARFDTAQFDPSESVVTPRSIFEDDQLMTVRDE